MKNKTKYIIVFIILAFMIILSFTIYSFASDFDKTKSNSILTKEKLSNTGNTYEKITTNDTVNKDFIIQKVNKYKTLIDSTSTSKQISNYVIKEDTCTINEFNNELDSQIESVVDYKDEVFCLNAKDGNLIHYVQKNPSLVSTNMNENEIKEIGLQLYDSIKDMLAKDYNYTELEQYDNEIWTIRFNKYYNNFVNPGEAVKISFSPESKEIVSLVVIDNNFANNTVEISEEDAFKIAKKYMEKTTATDMNVEMKIVRPNYFWYKDITTYKNIQTLRLAYVFTCNDEANVKIYVDCTTGEVIGGDMLVGGEM